MFIVTPTLEARPSSFRSGMNGILHPTALQSAGRQRDAMPLRWSLADSVAPVAINMALQKELFAASQLPRCRVKDTYKEQPSSTTAASIGYLRSTSVVPPLYRRSTSVCHTEVRRRYNGGTTEVLRRYYGGIRYADRAAGVGLWWIGVVLNG